MRALTSSGPISVGSKTPPYHCTMDARSGWRGLAMTSRNSSKPGVPPTSSGGGTTFTLNEARVTDLVDAHIGGVAGADPAFAPEAGDGDVRLRLAIGGRAGLGELEPPARIGVLLPRLGAVVWPDLGGALACLHRRLLGLVVPVLGRRDQRDMDDLPTPRHITSCLQLSIKIGERHVERASIREPFAEHADRVRIRRRCAQIEAQKAQPARPVADQLFHAGVGHVVLRRQHQHLEHHDRIIRRASALGSSA